MNLANQSMIEATYREPNGEVSVKSLLASLFQREESPLFVKEGVGEIFRRLCPVNYGLLSKSIVLFFLLIVLAGCAAQEKVIATPPPFPEGVLGARWGMQVAQVKQAIEGDGNRFFQEDTRKPPFALYATGTYMKVPATLSYFFTPKSGKLYRIDVTFGDAKMYESAKGYLVREFNDPTFSGGDTDHWSWPDNSLIILQKAPSLVQVSCSSGPFLKLNHEEGAGR